MTNLKNSKTNRELISLSELEKEFGELSNSEFACRSTSPALLCFNSTAVDLTYEGVGVA